MACDKCQFHLNKTSEKTDWIMSDAVMRHPSVGILVCECAFARHENAQKCVILGRRTPYRRRKRYSIHADTHTHKHIRNMYLYIVHEWFRRNQCQCSTFELAEHRESVGLTACHFFFISFSCSFGLCE